jgi:hypothetical protein
LKVRALEVDLSSLRRRELVPLHVTEFFTAMVVGAKSHQLRDVSFWFSAQQRLGDVKHADGLILAELDLLIKYAANLDDPSCFVKWRA